MAEDSISISSNEPYDIKAKEMGGKTVFHIYCGSYVTKLVRVAGGSAGHERAARTPVKL